MLGRLCPSWSAASLATVDSHHRPPLSARSIASAASRKAQARANNSPRLRPTATPTANSADSRCALAAARTSQIHRVTKAEPSMINTRTTDDGGHVSLHQLIPYRFRRHCFGVLRGMIRTEFAARPASVRSAKNDASEPASGIATERSQDSARYAPARCTSSSSTWQA
jgi:hypothetical protein